MHLGYRWLTRLDLARKFPTTPRSRRIATDDFANRECFSKSLKRSFGPYSCGLGASHKLAVDGTIVEANATPRSRVPPEKLNDGAPVSRIGQEYLNLTGANESSLGCEDDFCERSRCSLSKESWAAKTAYFDNYLIDSSSRVILGAEATPRMFCGTQAVLKNVRKTCSDFATLNWPILIV
jgi:hypothetical protein